MRKKMLGKIQMLALALCCAVILGVTLGSAQAVSAVKAELKPDMTIIIDGSARTFYNAGGLEVHPILYNGTTYLPVRAIGELMGKNVDWNQDTLTVTLSGVRTTPATAGTPDSAAVVREISVELRDDFTIIIDGEKRAFADAGGNRVYPLLYEGSTYLPIRAIGELMGKSVSWDGVTQTVTLAGSLVTDADSFSGGTQQNSQNPATGEISLEAAKAVALAHAQLSAGDVTFSKQETDWDDGRKVYELEFYTTGGVEYEYEILAAGGVILKFESDLNYYTPSGPVEKVISTDRAKEIALARIAGAGTEHITHCSPDHHDNGHLCYDVEVVYDCIEYEFEIDGTTGTILSSESEVLACNHAHHSGRHHGGHHRSGYAQGWRQGAGCWEECPWGGDCPWGEECPWVSQH